MTGNGRDDVWKRDEVDSPCVKVCLVHPDAGICLGCHRTRDEIDGWNRFTAKARQRILAELPGRGSLLPGRRRRRRNARKE